MKIKIMKRLKAAWMALIDPKIIEPKIIEVIKDESDKLTGALTRGTFVKAGEREFDRAQRQKQPLTLVFVDLDGLKKINDTYGHSAGDEHIKKFVKTALKHIRSVDLLARWGGDEFILLLSTTKAGAENTMERIRESFQHFSYGIDIWSDKSALECLIQNADKKMYEMKKTKSRAPV